MKEVVLFTWSSHLWINFWIPQSLSMNYRNPSPDSQLHSLCQSSNSQIKCTLTKMTPCDPCDCTVKYKQWRYTCNTRVCSNVLRGPKWPSNDKPSVNHRQTWWQSSFIRRPEIRLILTLSMIIWIIERLNITYTTVQQFGITVILWFLSFLQ